MLHDHPNMDKGISPNHLNLVGNFEAQVQVIMECVRLTKREVDHLTLLYVHLKQALQTKWPGCRVIPFGSIVTGLGIKTSDVDCYIELPEDTCDVDDPGTVIQARNILRKQHWLFQKTFAITGAKVPIVKFYHVPTNFYCDINFKTPSGVRNSRLLELLLNFDRRGLTLAVLIKYWAKVHKLTGTNLVSNYSLTLLVLFFLQQVNMLPPVSQLQMDHEMYVVDCWNTAINESFMKDFTSNNRMDMYELLGGFFKFYSMLNYDDNIISLFAGHLIPRSIFNSLDSVPGIFDLYVNNVNNDVCKPLKIDTKICVQDPFEHSRNCTMAVHPKLAMSLIAHFQLAARIYEENKRNNFIVNILYRKVPPSPTKKKNKGPNGKKNERPHTSNDIPITKGKVTKPIKNVKNTLKYNLTALYQQIKSQKAKQ